MSVIKLGNIPPPGSRAPLRQAALNVAAAFTPALSVHRRWRN